MQNLRDKLLKAGLVSEDQAKKAETATQAPRRPSPSQAPRREGATPRGERGPRERFERTGRPPPRREGRPPGGRPTEAAAVPVPKLPPLPGSKAAQRMESKKQVELDRKLRELVHGGQVPVDVGATVFYFMTRKGKLRRLELTETQAKQLENGELAVVERPEPAQIEHSLVPAAVAEQMYALSKKAVRFLNRKESPVGFMSDEDIKQKQAAEAAGEEPEEESAEGEASEVAEAAAAEAPAAEGTEPPRS
jgi:uncharacterized protein YaiL (DUF2058 family)